MAHRVDGLRRALVVAAVGLLVGCGGGGGDDGDCPDSPEGDYQLAVNIEVVCADDVVGVWSGDLVFLPPNEIRLLLYVPETPNCCPETLEMSGVLVQPDVYGMDDLPDRFVCALSDQYGYTQFGVRDAFLTLQPGGFDLGGGASVTAGPACLGTIQIDGTEIP